ncbi:MAG TPA: TolC family protein [Polyangiaceae bacterium]|nr:TolC family protein [Polyangiaceae bacterium]
MAGLVLLASRTVRAESLTFDQVLELAPGSPEAQAPAAELASRRQHDGTFSGSWAGTNVVLMPGATVSSPVGTGFEMQASVTQGWNLRGLGSSHQKASTAERGALDAETRARSLEARLEAAFAWLELWSVEQREVALRERLRTSEERVKFARRALETGSATRQALDEAETQRAELMTHALELEGERFAASNRLGLALGRIPVDGIQTAGPSPEPELPPLERMRADLERVDRLPAVQSSELAALAIRAREVEARALGGAVLQFGAQLERSSENAWVAYGIVGASLPSSGQTRRSESVLRGQASRQSLETAAARAAARAEISDALHEYEHTRQRLDTLDQVLLPALQRLEDARRASLARGQETQFGVFAAEERRRATEEQRIAALGRARWARVRLWLLLAELYRSTDDAPTP